MHRRSLDVALALAVSATACAPIDHALGHEAAGGSSQSGSIATTSGGGNAGGGGGIAFDGGTDGRLQQSCQYVDILFLVDNSPSMHPHQEKLAAAFPQFVAAMFDKLPPNVDLHVGLTSTAFFEGDCSEVTIDCETSQTPAEVEAHFIPPDQQNTGENGGQGRLYEFQGKRFFAVNTSDPDPIPLTTWFSGAATSLGEHGCSYEFPSAGVAYTASDANAGDNQGFFRDDDAVLLIFFLTDEPDKSFDANLAKYHDMIAGAKKSCGGDACIFAAGLINPCVRDTNQMLWKFMSAFGEAPIWGDIDGDGSAYAEVIGDSLAQVVKVTCDEVGEIK